MPKKPAAPTKPKSQLVREAIDKLLHEGRDVTTAAILALLEAAGVKNAKPMDIYQTPAWKELREKEKAGSSPPAAPVSPASNAEITKTEAVREALKKRGEDAKPSAVVQHVKDRYGMQVSAQLVYNLKNTLAQKAVKRGPGRPPKAQAASPAPAPRAAKPAFSSETSLDDIRAVKELVLRMGADKVRELAKVLA